jgi:hypothetical protein
MYTVCPQCRATFDQAGNCPTCGVRLQLRTHARAPLAPVPEDLTVRWQNTPGGRLVVGVVVAQGLAHGMQLACTGALLALGEDGSSAIWQTPTGGTVLLGLQAVALLLAGALAGAGRPFGAFFGLLVGVLSGGLFLVLQRTAGDLLAAATTVGVASVVGLVGGCLGGIIWKPLPALQANVDGKGAGGRTPARRGESILAGPVAWVRVFVGAAIAACGVFWPGVIVGLLLEAGMGRLRLHSPLQAHLITWEVAGLLLLLGGAVAGATTRNPLKQGVFVGLLAVILLTGNQIAARNLDADFILVMGSIILLLCGLGSWFGGQVFPPVAPLRRTSTY